MWWMRLAACHWTPAETGPDGMVGTLRDATGAPIPGIAIETVEALARTDPEGRFAVGYKEPAEVHFTRGFTFYQRLWLPTDLPVVDLRLPHERDVELECGSVACDVTLTWPLSEGYTARVAVRCERDRGMSLVNVPVGTPGFSCRDGLGAGEMGASLDDRGGVLVVAPPPDTLVVRIGGSPGQCEATADDVPLAIAPDGSFTATGRGLVTVRAVCDGRPARPAVIAASAGEVTLPWSASGPSVRFRGAVGEMEIQCRSAAGSWTATWRARADGVFLLPPLDTGNCEMVLASPDLRSAAWSANKPPTRPGVLHVIEPVPGALKGWLDLERPLVDGEIIVRQP